MAARPEPPGDIEPPLEFDPVLASKRPISATSLFNPSTLVDPKVKDGSAARKRYTITKVRESWTAQEHQRFLDAIKLYNRDWKRIEEYIGTKSVKQIRSHAQKYFLKVQKHGGSDFIPPARPKRKASPTNANAPSKVPEERIASRPPAAAGAPLLQPPAQAQSNASAMFSQWMSTSGLAPPAGLLVPAPVFPHTNGNTTLPLHSLMPLLPGNTVPMDDIARLRRTQEQFAQVQMYLNNAMNAAAPYSGPPGAPPQQPNYAKIYAFLGSLFDPATDNHVAALNLMSPTDRETVQVMMNNLAVNLHNSIASMERGDVIHSNPNAHHHPVPKEPPVFRPDRPRLGDDLLAVDGRPGLAPPPVVYPALPAFGNPRREMSDEVPLSQLLESPQQLRHEHGALYPAAGADYFK